MTDNGRDRVEFLKGRFKALGIETGEPAWSSWLLDRLLEDAVTAAGATLHDVYAGLDAALKDYSVPLTRTVANLIRDTVVTGFTQHRPAYQATDWAWANEELRRGASPARCYLFLHALPPEVVTPEAAAAVLHGLRGTAYEQEAVNVFSAGPGSEDMRETGHADGRPRSTRPGANGNGGRQRS